MSSNSAKGSGRKAQATAYKTEKRWEKNRKRKLLKLISANPNNKQLEAALSNIEYRRKKPITRKLTPTLRRELELKKWISTSAATKSQVIPGSFFSLAWRISN